MKEQLYNFLKLDAFSYESVFDKKNLNKIDVLLTNPLK